MIWFSPDVIEKCFLCLFSREEKNLKIFPAPGRENMSQSDPLWCIREVCLLAFLVSLKSQYLKVQALPYLLCSCATGVANLILTYRFSSFSALLLYHWIVWSFPALLLLCFMSMIMMLLVLLPSFWWLLLRLVACCFPHHSPDVDSSWGRALLPHLVLRALGKISPTPIALTIPYFKAIFKYILDLYEASGPYFNIRQRCDSLKIALISPIKKYPKSTPLSYSPSPQPVLLPVFILKVINAFSLHHLMTKV